MSQFKKLSALLALTVTGLFAGLACTGPIEATDDDQVSEAAQEVSSNPCRNKCTKTFEQCSEGKNPGGVNMCKKAEQDCFATCP